MAAQSVRAAVGNVQDDDTLGKNKDAITDFISAHYGHVKTQVGVGIVTGAIVVGGLLGALAGTLVWARDRIGGRTGPRSLWSRLLLSFLVTVALHGLVMLWAMAEVPQLYAEQWYASGGVFREVQIFATDFLGPKGVVLAGVVLILAFLVGSPSAWRGYPARARALAAKFTARRLVVIGAGGVAVILAALALRGPKRARAAEGHSAERMNVLILAADSLRADRLDPHGCPTSPGSRRAARASIARTCRSRARSPRGSRSSPGATRTTTASARCSRAGRSARKDFDALPERLARAGYATGVVSDYAGDIFSRIDLGFAHVDVPAFDFRQLVQQAALERETPLLPVSPLAARPRRLPGHARDERRRGRRPARAPTRSGALRRLEDAAVLPRSSSSRPRTSLTRRPRRTTAASPTPPTRALQVPQARAASGPRGPARRAGRSAGAGLYDGAVNAIDDGCAEHPRRARGATASPSGPSSSSRRITGRRSTTTGTAKGTAITSSATRGRTCRSSSYDPRRKTPRREPHIVRDVDLAPTLYELTGTAPPRRPRRPGRSPRRWTASRSLRRSRTPRPGCGSPRRSPACPPRCASPTPASLG